ncbi:LOW QUALITY PROTEIN: hypothetical protein KIPB_005418 [Kipferlia bialata]|uniref:Uncharacterized protein n=1 Tax=Kipferlia bialata TaxID=797122 RepID=A0A9K3CYH4_9EUKA|nr:LOW QUALITY PROTEIN: hypothetical protein KIPB_005418 [Kipferlia bialata]
MQAVEQRRRQLEAKFQEDYAALKTERAELLEEVGTLLTGEHTEARDRRERLYADWQSNVFLPLQTALKESMDRTDVNYLNEYRRELFEAYLRGDNTPLEGILERQAATRANARSMGATIMTSGSTRGMTRQQGPGMHLDDVEEDEGEQLHVGEQCLVVSLPSSQDPHFCVVDDPGTRQIRHRKAEDTLGTRSMLNVATWDKERIQATPYYLGPNRGPNRGRRPVNGASAGKEPWRGQDRERVKGCPIGLHDDE